MPVAANWVWQRRGAALLVRRSVVLGASLLAAATIYGSGDDSEARSLSLGGGECKRCGPNVYVWSERHNARDL